jgi:hypothetical protein
MQCNAHGWNPPFLPRRHSRDLLIGSHGVGKAAHARGVSRCRYDVTRFLQPQWAGACKCVSRLDKHASAYPVLTSTLPVTPKTAIPMLQPVVAYVEETGHHACLGNCTAWCLAAWSWRHARSAIVNSRALSCPTAVSFMRLPFLYAATVT